MRPSLFVFLFAMWVLILLGGAIVVVILGPISISGFGSLDMLVTSAIKAVTAVVLAVVWVLILSKIKNWIFRKEIRF